MKTQMNKKHILVAMPIVAMAVSIIGVSVFAQGVSVEQLGSQYNELKNKASFYKVENQKAIKSACDLEQQIANMKLAEHYSGKTKQPQDRIDVLTSKAKGEGLECKVF